MSSIPTTLDGAAGSAVPSAPSTGGRHSAATARLQSLAMSNSLSDLILRGRSTAFFLVTLLYAGAVSIAAFDFFGQALSPMLGYAALAPVGLANQVLQIVTGESIRGGGHLLHYMAGIIAYPLGWMMIVEPLRRAFTPSLHWSIAATVYGVALWVFALYVMAHLVAGNPAFLGFSGITWVALIGHVLFALVTAAVYRARYGN